MAKKLTVYDATKDELIQYFFLPEEFGGGYYRIPALKDKFLLWLQRKRNGDLMTAQDATIDASKKALREYIDLVKKMNDEPDVERKLEIAEQANAAYKRYERAEKQYETLDKKIMEGLGL